MELNYIKGRVILKADKDGKNWHTFSDGKKIRIEREYDNFDKKHTNQVLGEVISAEYVPKGAMILFHHNAMHPVNQIFNHSNLSGEEIASGVEVFSLRESECYLWKMPGDKVWNPLNGFATALRVFKPYNGTFEGILPEKLKEILYITSGNLKGKACQCLKASDMPIIFNNEEGFEETIIRLRHFEGEDLNEREEVVAVNDDITKKIKKGELYVGLTAKDCSKLN